MTKETFALYLENGFKGRRNVISSRELERVLGISGNELRRRVNRLRQDTVPIAADQRGYRSNYWGKQASTRTRRCRSPALTELSSLRGIHP